MAKRKGWTAIAACALALTGGAWIGRDQLSPFVDKVVAAKAAPDKSAESTGSLAQHEGGAHKKGGAAAPPVTAALAAESDMPVMLSAPGTVEPLATVAVRPRVDGQIVEVGFEEGDLVEQGRVLFRLDDRLVKAQISQAAANIAKDQASLRDAEATLSRREALIAQKIVTEAQLDTARFTVEGLKASIAAGQAFLESQKTQLDYLTIRAPITGRTGSIGAKLGSTIRTTDTLPLVVINQTRPIAVSFSVPQSDLVALRRALAGKSTAEVTLQDATPVRLKGTIGMIDNQVDKTTGTVQAKVVVENGDELLWPGQAVELALTVEVKPKVVSVPASAVLPAQQGMMVWVIDRENRVSPRVIKLDRIVSQTAFIQDGLQAGERVVTMGQLRLAPGMSITVQEPAHPASSPTSSKRRANERT